MKIDGLKIVECNSSKVLMDLYNAWTNKTAFSSVFDPDESSWLDFVEYGKEHSKEATEFALEWLNDWESDWAILTFIDEAIGNPIDHDKTTGYISPKREDVVNAYKIFLNLYLDRLKTLEE